VADGIDTSTPTGKILLGVLGTLAEVELDQRREYWDASVRRAIERGVHVGPAPLGYVKARNGTLEVDPATAPLVIDAFEKRGRGASWGKLADAFQEAGVPISKSGVRSMIASRTYRGEVVKGVYVKADAHQPLVDETTWQKAQFSNGAVRNRRLADTGFLTGLVTCGACGHRMSVSGGGGRTLSYACKSGGAVPCPAPAYVSVEKLDRYVEPMVLKRLGRGVNVKKALADQTDAIAELSRAHEELTAFVQHASAAELGDLYGPEIAKRREALRLAQVRVDETTNLPGAVSLKSWNLMSDIERREVVAPLINAVTVTRTNRGRWQPLDERVSVLWK
jgi:hypothetical protein